MADRDGSTTDGIQDLESHADVLLRSVNFVALCYIMLELVR